MIVVVEGPDGSGKTTLCEQIARAYHLEYHHEGPPPADRDALEHYGYALLSALESKYDGVVFDRLALGELVYGPILRGRDRLTWDGYRLWQRIGSALGVKHVLCLPSYEECRHHWAGRKQRELITEEPRFKRTYDRWEALSPHAGSFVWNRELEPQSDLWRYLDTRLETCPAGVIGSPSAWVLFVGEKPGNPAGIPLPFYNLRNASHFLNTALWEAGFTESEVAFTNALDGRDFAAKVRPGQVVVALGKKAANFIGARANTELPHPQYWKRFHHQARAVYVDALRRIRTEFWNAL